MKIYIVENSELIRDALIQMFSCDTSVEADPSSNVFDHALETVLNDVSADELLKSVMFPSVHSHQLSEHQNCPGSIDKSNQAD